MTRYVRAVIGSLIAATLTACGGGSDSTAPAPGPAPSISTVAPSRGTVGTELTITGLNFRTGATVNVGTTRADSITVASATTIYARVPAGVTAGQSYPVSVKNSDGSTFQLAAAFTAVAPTLSYVNGATQPSGNSGSTVIIEGSAFGDMQGTGKVLFSNGTGGTLEAVIASAADWTDTFIITSVPSGAATGDVKVMTATGSSNALTFTIVSNAAFSPSTIAWSSTAALPVGLSGHDAQFALVKGASVTSNVVYVTGGADSTLSPRAGVLYSVVQSSGQLGAWVSTTAMPGARAFHASVVATPANSRVKGVGYIYVLGGIATSTGAPVTSIYRGTLAQDGSVSSWSLVGDLPAALQSLGAVIFRGDIFIGGGATTGNAPVATVYRARIDSLGTLGTWQAQAALPYARAYHGFAQFGGYLYSVGGDSGAVAPFDGNYTSNGSKLNQVAYAKIDLRSNNLTTAGWVVNASSLSKAVSKHTAVVAGADILVSAGLYNGAANGSSEQAYAQINSDGTVGSFAGATGAHTITSAGGKDLFNHAAVSYIDANGVAHVVVIGGDDVNAPGKMRAESWYY